LLTSELRAWVVEEGDNRSFYVEELDHSIVRVPSYELGGSGLLGPGEHSDEEVEKAIADHLSRYGPIRVQKCLFHSGEYHPRIWRGEFSPQATPESVRALSNCLQQAQLLFEHQNSVFRAIHPDARNAGSFGHEPRSLLILACTTVEASLKAILNANGYRGKDDRTTMNDYVNLAKPMRLREWIVAMPLYPDWPRIQPFASWDETKPTQSLPWYDAYNQTKHDGETKLHLASLANTVDAVAAVFILLLAQFGPDSLSGRSVYSVDDYHVIETPSWSPVELYPPFQGGDGRTTSLTPVPLFADRTT